MIHLGIVANSDNINIDNKNLDNIVLSKYYGKVTAHKEITNMNIQKNEFDDDLLLELICSISSKTNLYNHRLFKNIPLEPINVLLVKICLKKIIKNMILIHLVRTVLKLLIQIIAQNSSKSM